MRYAARAHAGLTLIEIMVALGIMAVLASLAVPEIGRMTAYRKMQSTAEQLAAEMNEARYDAAQQGRTLHLNLQAGSRWCWSLSDAPGCACGEARSCQRKRVQAPARSSVNFESPLQLDFQPAADARPRPVAVNLVTPYDERLRVTMTPMGRARICAPEGPRSGYPRC